MGRREPAQEMRVTADTRLADAKTFLRDAAKTTEGGICPCCEKFTKVYRHRINSTQARELIDGWVTAGYTVTGSFPLRRGSTTSLLRHWGLIESTGEHRADTGSAGNWRVTRRGVDYIQNRVAIARYAILYDNRLLALEGPDEKIGAAFKSPFHYAEAMQGVDPPARTPEPEDNDVPLW